jgi:hypothetical protein
MLAGARLPKMSHRIEPSVPGCAEGPQLVIGQPPLEPLGQARAIELGAYLMQAGVKGLEAERVELPAKRFAATSLGSALRASRLCRTSASILRNVTLSGASAAPSRDGLISPAFREHLSKTIM